MPRIEFRDCQALPIVIPERESGNVIEVAKDSRQQQFIDGIEGSERRNRRTVKVQIEGHESDRRRLRREKLGHGRLHQAELQMSTTQTFRKFLWVQRIIA